MKQRIITYAQNREDVILAGFFDENETGFYVDIGAHHPEVDSVTKYFYDRGWSGINIEPNIDMYKKLCLSRVRDINVNVGIASKPGSLKLRIYDQGDGLSTFSKEMIESYESDTTYFTEKYHENTVEVVTLKSLLKKHKINKISFLKIDIEGYEYDALISNDWKSFRPEVICIEANHVLKDWRTILVGAKYEKVFLDGLNEYYVDTTLKKKRNFNYVDSIVFKEPLVNYMLLEDFEERDKAISWLEQRIKDLEKTNKKIISELDAVTPLRKHLKKSFWAHLRFFDSTVIRILSSRAKFTPLEIKVENNEDLLEKLSAYDADNYARFRNNQKKPFLLRLYLYSRHKGVGIMKRLHSIRVRRKSSK